MKNKFILFVLCLFVANFLAAQKLSTVSITSGGVIRTYLLYVPKLYDGKKSVPLVFNFHGYGSNATQQLLYGDFRAIADTANFILALPEGTVVNGSAAFNNFGALDTKPDDVLLASNLIDSLSAKYNIDQSRIYSTGMSNGGFESYDLACFLSTRIAAIASVCGTMVQIHLNACNPKRSVPILHFHGTTDNVVSYDGKGGILNSVHVDTLIKFWVNKNKCNPTPVATKIPDTNTADKSTVEQFTYKGAAANVEFYKITDGGHTWPNSIISNSFGNTNRDINASELIWRFFKANRLPTTPTNDLVDSDLQYNIYPNPSNGNFTIETNTAQNADLQVFDIVGKLVFESKINDNKTTIQLPNQAKGIYFYKIKNEKSQTTSGKLIVE